MRLRRSTSGDLTRFEKNARLGLKNLPKDDASSSGSESNDSLILGTAET